MAKRKGKSVSFDAMVKFFLQYYGIATKKDMDRLLDRLDRLERTIQRSALAGKGAGSAGIRRTRAKTPISAADTVLSVIRRSRQAMGFADIREKTGFDDKKLRNIIFRLNKLGKIQRISRGIYKAV